MWLRNGKLPPLGRLEQRLEPVPVGTLPTEFPRCVGGAARPLPALNLLVAEPELKRTILSIRFRLINSSQLLQTQRSALLHYSLILGVRLALRKDLGAGG